MARPRKSRVARIAHAECTTPENYRWLKRMIATTGAASLTEDGFMIHDEARWSELLAAAEGKEVK